MGVLHIIAPKIFQIMIFCDSWTKIKLNVDYSYSAYIEALSRYVYTESQTNLRFTYMYNFPWNNEVHILALSQCFLYKCI